jgi:hypothetical protein
METRPSPTGVTYAQATKGQTELPQTNIPPSHTTNTAHTANGLNELKQMMKILLGQMGTLISLITVLINKNN